MEQETAAERDLELLATHGYATATRDARAAWPRLKAAIAEEQRWVQVGDERQADSVRTSLVDPAFEAMNSALAPIGAAINRAGRVQVERAQNIASRAATTVLLALAVALAIALAVAAWLTRALLPPIQKLRGAMSSVASGDFEPHQSLALTRPDEIGDLNRSFARMTEQLAELDRLKAEFVSVASHELKTPLSVIKGYISLMEDGIYGDVPDAQRKILASIGTQSDQLTRLVQQLLDVSRFEAGGGRLNVQPIELPAFLREIATTFEALAFQNDIDFRLDLSPALPERIQGDADRLREVIGNLLSNAFKFTPREGHIWLRAREARRRDDSGILIEVTDTGVGVPKDKLSRIFDKFFQVDNAAQPRSVGSGLGLAISREIVEAHGGTIAAESQIGQGTTVRVFLPLAPPSPGAE
jgi:signal transduction histidine kinase